MLRLRGVDLPDGVPPSLVHVGATEIPHFRPLLEYQREIKIEKSSSKYIYGEDFYIKIESNFMKKISGFCFFFLKNKQKIKKIKNCLGEN